jgi:hypothetical protein
MMLAETYIGHIAKTLGIHPHKIRVCLVRGVVFQAVPILNAVCLV